MAKLAKNIKPTANDSESNEEPNEISTAKPTPVDKETSDESNEEGRDTLVESDFPRCSWSNSSKGCLLPGVEPIDVCGVDGCQVVFHHLCQTEWEIYQYHLENPNGDPRFVVMIQMERRDVSIIMFILNWLLQKYSQTMHGLMQKGHH